MPTRYDLSLPDTHSGTGERARGAESDLAFRAQGADAIATELQEALRTTTLFERWRLGQPDPDAVDAGLGATDPSATVVGNQRDLHVDLVVTTSIPGNVFKQRMRLLAGSGWTLTDVKSA